MTTARQDGFPITSESFMFDLVRRMTGQRREEDLSDEDNFRIVTQNMHSGLFM
jgi:hypothetical protein